MSIHDYKVRFGDISIGPFLHASKLFDPNVQAMEELSYRIDNPIEEVTAVGHIPFATDVVHCNGSQTIPVRYGFL